MKVITAAVRGALAHHTGRSIHAIHAGHHPERDLDLTPLEIIIIGMELEELAGAELPAGDLAEVETVGDLFDLVARGVVESGPQRAVA